MAGRTYDLKYWSAEDDAKLFDLWHSELGIKQICKQLGRVREDIVNRAIQLKYPKKKPGHRKSNLEEAVTWEWKACNCCGRGFPRDSKYIILCQPCKDAYA